MPNNLYMAHLLLGDTVPLTCQCSGANPDDAITELELRGVYRPDLGDRIWRLIFVARTAAGTKQDAV